MADFTVPRPAENDLSPHPPNPLSPPPVGEGRGGAARSAAGERGEVRTAPEPWLTAVGADLRQAEYQVTWQEQTYLADVPAAYQAPNRAHNLRTYFTPEGIRIVPRTWYTAPLALDTALTWTLGLELVGFGAAGDIQGVGAAELTAAGHHVAGRRGDSGIVEWYQNDERGLEQGFTLAVPPSERSEVVLELVVSGNMTPVLTTDGQAVEFFTAGGERILRYGELRVHDAAGRELPAYLALDGPQLTIHVDTTTAAYPITVDPLVTFPDWTGSDEQAGCQYGYAVGTAGGRQWRRLR